MAMSVSMLAWPRRARRAAWAMKGQPAQNCTGVARTSALHRAQGSIMWTKER